MSEMAKSDAPTLFQVNGPVGLANWKDYCYDLSGTKIAGDLTSDTYALKDGDQMLGIGYVIESYGLITNKTLLEKAGYTVDDIKSFDDLKKVAEDITARKDELGFSAFTSAGMDGSSDWRYRACAPALRTTGASTRKPARTTSTQRSTSCTGAFPLTRVPRPWLTTWASLSPSRMLSSPPTSSSRPIRK